MKTGRKIFTAVLSAACILSLAACGHSAGQGASENKNREEEQAEKEWTQRQKELLEKMGLSGDYDELTDTQKSAVTSADDMLAYLEEKYGKRFCYLSYAPSGTLDKEHLEAYPADGQPYDKVTVYRTYENGEYSYEDDYENILIRPRYEEKVRHFAEEYFPAEGIKVYTDIKSIDGSVTEENILENVSAVTYVFTDDSVCSAEAYERFVDACGQWLKEHCQGVPAGIYLRMTQSEAWAKISEADYEDSIREDIFTAENDCSISGSGKVTIY